LTRPIAGDTNARDLVEIRRFFDYGATGGSDTRGEFAFLADRPPSDWEKITERADVRRFSRGDTIIAAGDKDQALYIQVEGSVGVFLPGADQPFTVIEAPSVLGEVAFLDGGPRTATLVAIDDCGLLRLSMTRGSRRRTRAEVPYTADYFFWKKKGA